MENVSKALLIAAGILIGLIVLTMLVVMHRQVTSYYTAKEKARTFEQLQEFNAQYTPYDRKNVRGTELISLINKIINFNEQEDELGIQITIDFDGSNDPIKVKNAFYYNNNDSYCLIDINKDYNYTKNSEDTSIKKVLENAEKIEEKYGKEIAIELTANMYKIFDVNESDEKEVEKRTKYFESLRINPQSIETDIDELKKDMSQYYQYGQLKKAFFNCTELTYTENGRVKSFKFIFNGKINTLS